MTIGIQRTRLEVDQAVTGLALAVRDYAAAAARLNDYVIKLGVTGLTELPPGAQTLTAYTAEEAQAVQRAASEHNTIRLVCEGTQGQAPPGQPAEGYDFLDSFALTAGP